MSFIDFSAGQVFTSAQADILMRQGILSFASTADRDSALSGVLAHPLWAYTTDTETLWRYNGSAWKAINSVATSYTPTWTNLTVGNGTLTATKQYIGGALQLAGNLTFGTTTAITGAVSMTIPDSLTSTAAGAKGSGVANDASASTLYGLTVSANPSDTQIIFASSGQVNTTVPFTWTTSDGLGWQILVGVA